MHAWPQFPQTSAGTWRITMPVSRSSNVIVAVSGAGVPCVQMTQVNCGCLPNVESRRCGQLSLAEPFPESDEGYGQREAGTRARSEKGGGLTGSGPEARMASV